MVGFQNNSVFGEAGQTQTGKSDLQESAGANPPCPQCSSKRLYRDGLRYLSDGDSVQRWLCRDCGFRFSEQPLQKSSRRSLNMSSALSSRLQICAPLREAKNLTEATEIKTVAGTPNQLLPLDAKGIITKYMAYLEREGYSENNRYIGIIRRLLNLGANLYDPEDVKTKIAQAKVNNTDKPWRNGSKMLSVYAYDAFAKMEKITWNMPNYTQEESLFYVPDEKELDALVAASKSRRMTAFLQCLKETYADPGEVLGLKWKDQPSNVININRPVKGHLPGQCQISNKLVAMLDNLPKKSERIFPTTYAVMAQSFRTLRKATAAKLQNPRILNITFKSFRHYGGSWLAHVTEGNVLAVKKALRHKRVENTMK